MMNSTPEQHETQVLELLHFYFFYRFLMQKCSRDESQIVSKKYTNMYKNV